jgi:DNA processing protein
MWPAAFARSSDDRAALLVLLSLPSLTPRRLLVLSQEHPTAGACLDAAMEGGVVSETDVGKARSLDASLVAERVINAGARLVAVGDPCYPHRLYDLFDPPAGLFVRGADLTDMEPCVAVVGARNCSPSGAEIAAALGRSLAGAGGWVVSGAAYGIDGAAHRGALDAGRSAAVLGCGIDVAYPSRNRRLIERLAEAGAVISEYPPGTRPEPFRFPARNRLVAALSVAVVVVEGAMGSGSMITADHALDMGREVFAVPGAVSSALAQVPLALLRDGAGVIRGPDDLLHDLGLAPQVPRTHDAPSAIPSGIERTVWEALGRGDLPDGVAAVTHLPLPDVLAALLSLELQGLVSRRGGRYERRPFGGR